VSRDGAEPVDGRDVFALAEALAQLTCEHLPWSDQRVIAIEMDAGQCDLAIDDMVRGRARSHRGAVARVAGPR
jgi:hypothetical protein